MNNDPTYLDVFIAHGWKYSDPWVNFVDLLDGLPGLRWRNFSVPWHDPMYTLSNDSGRDRAERLMRAQVVPAHIVVVLAELWYDQRLRPWLEKGLATARELDKKVVVVEPEQGGTVPDELQPIATVVVPWDRDQVQQALTR